MVCHYYGIWLAIVVISNTNKYFDKCIPHPEQRTKTTHGRSFVGSGTLVPNYICPKLLIKLCHYLLVSYVRNILKSIFSKLQIWVSHYFLVGRVKNTRSKIYLFQITNNAVSLFLGQLLSLFPTQIYILKNISPTLKGAQKLPNLHSSTNCWHNISNNKKFPKIVGCIFPLFQKCIFPNPTPELSNNHSK